jgi:LPS export ABC transporter protein LptC
VSISFLNFKKSHKPLNHTLMMKKKLLIGIIAMIGFLVSSCEEVKPTTYINYKGPEMEIEGIELLYSDSARLMVRMTTAKQMEMQNKDKVFPKEINLQFYDRLGNLSTTLRGDSGRFVQAQNIYKVMGHVKVNSLAKGETLETKEMIWYPAEKKVVSNHHVKAVTPTDILYGTGLTANQDFTQWTLRNPTGQITSPLQE